MKNAFWLISLLCILPCKADEGSLRADWYSWYLGNKLVQFAQMFEGVPYDYANSDPMRGFDCSGFVQFVYGSFNVKLPRSSAQYATIGRTISLNDVQAGDILLFTGSDASSKTPGHLGIVISGEKPIRFMHSATSNRRGIMTSSLEEAYFKQRFIKVIRVL